MSGSDRATRWRWGALAAGPLLGLVVYLLLPETYTNAEGELATLGQAGRASAAVGVWMAVWWLSEAVHISITALLPLVAMPVTGAMTVRAAAAPYAHPIIFLFMGGFIISLSMQRWGLHRRIALATVRAIGAEPRRLVGGFMLATAALSMWVSNTATTLMMLPIATSVLDRFGVHRPEEAGAGEAEPAGGGRPESVRLAVCLMLGIAYAASIGGLATPIGSPPNGVALSYIDRNLGGEVSFAQWMLFAMPVVAVFLPIAWWLLTRILFPLHPERFRSAAEAAEAALERPGPMNRGERATAVVFAAAVAAWVSRQAYDEVTIGGVRPFSGSSGDALIAMAAAMLLFVIPLRRSPRTFVMDWHTAVKLPWGILILFGGGLSLASALDANGVSAYLASQFQGMAGAPAIVLVLATVALVIFMTELTSNTATATTLVPILGALAAPLGVHAYALILPAALAATCAFMLPVATPPNAIVFSAGHVRMADMARAGLVLNVVGMALITVLMYLLMGPLLGIELRGPVGASAPGP